MIEVQKKTIILMIAFWTIRHTIIIYGIYTHTYIYVLVSHIKQKTQQQWVKEDGERKGREAPRSHTPVIRVRADDVRVPRRAAVAPRLLAFDEVEAEGEWVRVCRWEWGGPRNCWSQRWATQAAVRSYATRRVRVRVCMYNFNGLLRGPTRVVRSYETWKATRWLTAKWGE